MSMVTWINGTRDIDIFVALEAHSKKFLPDYSLLMFLVGLVETLTETGIHSFTGSCCCCTAFRTYAISTAKTPYQS